MAVWNLKILITGGLGFLGGRLGKYLMTYGHYVCLASRSSSSKPTWLNIGDVRVVDWNDPASLRGLCKGIDVVIHAAGMGANECLADPSAAIEINEGTTTNLLETAINNNVKIFVYISTAHVYRSPLQGEITESSMLLNPHPYATSKAAGEQATLRAHTSGFQTTVCRLANTFGYPVTDARVSWTLVINDFCKQVARTGTLHIRAPSGTTRNFIGMNDACEALRFLCTTSFESSATLVCNLGGESRTLFEVALAIQQLYEKHYGRKIQIICDGDQENIGFNELKYKTDILHNLGWKERYGFSRELFGLVEYCEREFG